MQAALTTIVADRFPEKERGIVSGFVGAGMTAGGTIGIVGAGYMAASLTLAYAVFAAAIALACVTFVILNPEPRLERKAPPVWRARAFFKSFWVSPREHPHFRLGILWTIHYLHGLPGDRYLSTVHPAGIHRSHPVTTPTT